MPVGASSYIERQADTQLFERLQQGELCYVLNARQMGKSSLMVRCARRLENTGHTTAILDLTAVGQSLTPEQWYYGLLNLLGQQTNMEDELDDFWFDHESLGPMQRFFAAIKQLALPSLSQVSCTPDSPYPCLIVFVDEIDVVRSINTFDTDEFFAGIRQCLVGRASEPILARLTFCLLGTATPAELIKDVRITPFNIGKRIELRDFTEEEAYPLAEQLVARSGEKTALSTAETDGMVFDVPAVTSLSDDSRFRRFSGDGEFLLSRILHWTGGHPYLTQRIAAIVSREPRPSVAVVDRIVAELFLAQGMRDTDDNLSLVAKRLLLAFSHETGTELEKRQAEIKRYELLTLYHSVWQGKPVRDEEGNELCEVLKLSGIVKLEYGLLQIRNEIYRRVFDDVWIEKHLPGTEVKRQQQAFRRGVAFAGTIAVIVLSLIGSLAFIAIRKTEEAERTAYIANMNLIEREWEACNISHILEILQETKNSPLRGFEWGYWNWQCNTHLQALTKHSKAITSVRYSPDGSRILSVSLDSTARLWDARNGNALFTFSIRNSSLTSADFSPDGRRIALSSDDGGITLCDAKTGNTQKVLHVPKSSIQTVVFSSDGGQIVAALEDRRIRIWDAHSGRSLRTLVVPQDRIQALALSPKGDYIASSGTDGKVFLWNATTGQRIMTLFGHKDLVYAIDFSPDSRFLITGSLDNTARIWDVATGVSRTLFFGHRNAVMGVRFSPNGKHVATVSLDNTARIWNATNGKEEFLLRGHTSGLLSVDFAPDGKTLVTGSQDKTIRIWDIQKTREYLPSRFEGKTLTLKRISPDGTRFIPNSRAKVVEVRDRSSKRLLLILKGHTGRVDSATFSPNGKRIVTSSWDNTVKLWDAVTGKELLSLPGFSGFNYAFFSGDGKRIKAVNSNGDARIWFSDIQEARKSFVQEPPQSKRK